MTNTIDNTVNKILDEVIKEYTEKPVDIFNYGGGRGETKWMREFMIPSYKRTIYDIVNYFTNEESAFKEVKILEIGPWLGVVSVCLKRLGFDVHVQEIPEFLSNKNLQNKFIQEQIPFEIVNLSDYKLPYSNSIFDGVIMCEVLEHLNFNPLPVFQEINRIIKQNSLFYIALPNLTFLPKRIKFLFGKSINDPIENYFRKNDDYEKRYKSSVNNLKALIFRDSFSDAMIKFLKHSFGETVFIWHYTLDKELIEKEKPDIVIQIIVERNIEQLF